MKMLWDEPKREAKFEGHGFDFAELRNFDWDEAVVIPTRASVRGGSRFQAIGFLDGVLISVIFAPLGSEGVSIISMRRASVKERLRYG